MEFTIEEQEEYNKLIDNYAFLLPFLQKYKKATFMQFDYALVHDLTLFRIDPSFSFENLDKDIAEILKVMPAIKNIFAKPFIHLKDQNVIIPTEAVRIINNATIQHISSHSELWTNLNEDGIKPSRLLTRIYEDDYGIYENLVFCQTIQQILSYTKYNIQLLKDLIFTNQTIEVNILERVNHLNYFLALGKLHTGYSRNFDLYYHRAENSLNKLMFILKTIQPRLKLPVFKNNKKNLKPVQVHKTNLLAMHKDYHQIFKISKYFENHKAIPQKELTKNDLGMLQKEYSMYCIWLLIFSITHFNFTCDENKEILFSRLNMTFELKNWSIHLKNKTLLHHSILLIEIKKDTAYHIVCVPTILKDFSDLEQSIKKEIKADEYHILSPFEENHLPIQVTDIESFRRLQQMILRGMIYADHKKEICPFCQKPLVKIESDVPSKQMYECLSCRTKIVDTVCPTTNQTYSYTEISGLIQPMIQKDSWLYKRKKEAQMYFRNITEITDDLKVICPHCKQIHQE